MAEKSDRSRLASRDAESFARLVREEVRDASVYLVPAHDDITVKLNQNECPFDVPVPVKHLLLEQFRKAPWNRYPSEFSDDLRLALGNSIGVSADSIILGNGSNELAQFLGHALIRPGARVVLLDPMFSLFEKIVHLCGGRAVSVGCEEDLTTDPDAILKAAQESDADLVIIASPNNPTGKSVPVERLADVAGSIDGLLLVDEAYHEFLQGPTALTLLDEHPNVLVMRTFSKTIGLAGLRLGYLVANPTLTGELLKARLPFMIDRLTEIVAKYLIQHPEIVRERVKVLTEERERLYAGLNQMPGVEVVGSETNFVIFRTDRPAGEIQSALSERGVLVRNVSGYEKLPRYVRVNAGLPDENKAFLSALNAVLFSPGDQER